MNMNVVYGSFVFTHRIEIDVAAELIHIQYQSVVDQIHGEPNAQEANRYQT